MMLPNGKGLSSQNMPLDVLTSLPENVIDDILKGLPLQDAVKTSILSSKWRYKWCRIPRLILDESFWGTTRSNIPLATKFTKIIFHLLAFHTGPIQTFFLSIDLGDCPEIDKLIYFLSRSGVQNLFLIFDRCGPYKLPSSIFACLKLRWLCLQNCFIKVVPPAFKRFDSLTRLLLQNIRTSSKILESLISNCPLLELVLSQNWYTGAIEINAPRLRTFNFVEYIGSICLKSVPRLQKLTLEHVKYHVGVGNCLESFAALEYLHLNHLSLQFLIAGEGKLLPRFSVDLNCLKRLLIDVRLGELDSILCTLFLIRRSQYLQYLEIQVDGEDDDIPELQCLELKAFSDVTFSHLKYVKLKGTIGSSREMQLIELLLAKSPVLEKMIIEPTKIHTGLPVKIPIVLNSFRRASPEVVVVYDYYHD